jgi:hypothetical protein
VIEVRSAEEACDVAGKTLAQNPYDVPFALVYLLDEDATHARLVCASGLEEGEAGAPEQIALTDSHTWPLSKVFETGEVEVVSDLAKRFGITTGGPWPEPCESALFADCSIGYGKPTGFLVAGLSPRRIVDAEYRSFLDLIAGISALRSQMRARTRKSANAPRRWRKSIAPRRHSSQTSVTSFARH